MNRERFSIRITYPNGIVAYMSFRDRTSWCRSQANKHLRDWIYLHGIKAELEKIEG
jgi:hypothetical protein